MPDEKPAYFRHGDTEIELPIIRGSENELGADISKLRSQTGVITLDYGYMNTGSTESAITFIDGDKGILRYRGYDIEDLAEQEHPSFLETAWLVIYGELPTAAERTEFSRQIRLHTLVHEDVKRFYYGFPKDAHPMATTASVVNALATFYQDSEDPHDPAQVQLSIVRLMAKLPTVAARPGQDHEPKVSRHRSGPSASTIPSDAYRRTMSAGSARITSPRQGHPLEPSEP